MDTSLEDHLRLSKGIGDLVSVVQQLSLARDFETVARIVPIAARKLTGADGATFILKEFDYCHYVDEDAVGPLWKGSRFHMNSCVSGWAMRNKTPVAITDISRDERISRNHYDPTFVKSLAVVPIRLHDPIGAIGNYWAAIQKPHEWQIQMLQSLADSTSIALENVSVYAELEKKLRDRTNDLEAANKTLQAYSHSISHDLRAPLRSIKGFFEILYSSLKDQFTEQQLEMAQRVNNNVEYMGNLIDGLLVFSRMGKQKLNKTTVDVQSMVNELCSTINDQSKPRDIEFLIHELPSVFADMQLLRQVWVNLISNAVKYTGKRISARIEIGSTQLEDGVEFFIKDNGVGFDMRYAEKLFAVFQRLHTTREFDGIGVGLSIVEQIISKHNGSLRVDAQQNVGATFFFTLPKAT